MKHIPSYKEFKRINESAGIITPVSNETKLNQAADIIASFFK
jgi:hypothetical protein